LKKNPRTGLGNLWRKMGKSASYLREIRDENLARPRGTTRGHHLLQCGPKNPAKNPTHQHPYIIIDYIWKLGLVIVKAQIPFKSGNQVSRFYKLGFP
jgi:hypothetical protein